MDAPSVHLLARWQQGDQQAAQELFRRYLSQLIALARSRLSSKLAGRIDPEDVVQSAYRSFFAGAREGQYTLERGGDLWQLLVSITLHKLRDQVKHSQRAKRDVGREQHFGSEDSLFGLQADVLAGKPSPLEALGLVDELQAVMQHLDPLQRQMLELRLEGYSLDEIAARTERCTQTVRRTLERIKKDLEQKRSQVRE